jgi:hypothetical protein
MSQSTNSGIECRLISRPVKSRLRENGDKKSHVCVSGFGSTSGPRGKWVFLEQQKKKYKVEAHDREGSEMKGGWEDTHLYSMMSVPTKLAMLMLENAALRSRHTAAVVRLKRMSVSINCQYAAAVGTSPMSGYAIAPNTNGGTTRRGRMSKRTLAEKYVKEE